MDVGELVKIKQEEQHREYYDKYMKIFETAITFLKTKKVMLYGGVALDQYMPKEFKIYESYLLPDIDLYCPTPRKLANSLVSYLKKKGYKFSSVTPALHEGTFKVYSEGLPIVDMSYMELNAFNKISKYGRKGDMGIKLAAPTFIQHNLHLMLANSSVERWEKVTDRIQKFYAKFKPRSVSASQFPIYDPPSDIVIINKAIHEYVSANETMMLSTPAICMMLKKNPKESALSNIPYTIAMIHADPKEFAEKMLPDLPLELGLGLTVSKLHNGDEHLTLPPHVLVHYKDEVVAIFFEASGTCFGYNVINDVRIATIHTMITIYIAMLLSAHKHFELMNKSASLEKIVAMLSKKSILPKPSHIGILQPYAMKCMGEHIGVATMRRRHFEKK
jgi:hypothetical protein